MHFFGNASSLECKKPVLFDTELMGGDVDKLQEKFLDQAEVKEYLEVLTSGLLKTTTFPPTFLSPELLQFCVDHYDTKTRSIPSKNGEPMLSITRETISSVLKLPQCAFASFALASQWFNTKKILQNVVTKWLGSGRKRFMGEVQDYPK